MDASHFIELFLNLGLFGMVVIALAEKFAPIFPSYVMLMLLGMTVSDRTTLVMTILATVVGSLAGSIAWYGIGRALGARRAECFVAHFGKYVFFSLRTYKRLADAYRRNHFLVTLVGQTVPVARIYLALPAGVFRLRPIAFVFAASFGILLWNTPFLTLGYVLRGGGFDPVNGGFWVSVGLIGIEMAIVLGIRLCSNLAPQSNHPGGATRPAQIREFDEFELVEMPAGPTSVVAR